MLEIDRIRQREDDSSLCRRVAYPLRCIGDALLQSDESMLRVKPVVQLLLPVLLS